MAYRAETCARNAEGDRTNEPGYCLQQVRLWCGITAKYGDAATAWRNVNNKHTDRHPQRGAAVYWTGGSRGYGHIAMCVRGGTAPLIRSTDAGGAGRVATVPLGWFETHWGQHYAGWAFEINEQTIPHTAVTPAPTRTSWQKVREALLRTLNGTDARAVDKGRNDVQHFMASTRRDLANLPKK